MPGKREFESDGQLPIIQDYLASEAYSRQIEASLQEDISETKAKTVIKMSSVMQSLEKISRFRREKFVYEFRVEGGLSNSNDLLVINFPLIDEDGTAISVRYLFASRAGFGYLRFSFDEAKLYPEGSGNIKIVCPFVETSIEAHGKADDFVLNNKIDNIQTLNAYFKTITNYSSSNEFITRLFLSPDDKDYSSGLLNIIRRDIGGHKIKLDYDLNGNDLQTDLAYILEQMMVKRQMEIDKENASLQRAQEKLDLANGVQNILSDTLGEEPAKNTKKDGFFDKLKRKRG